MKQVADYNFVTQRWEPVPGLFVDELIRHKWPEEKPVDDGQYLIRIIAPSGSVFYRLRPYEDGKWFDFGNYITHWWELPEV